MARSADSRTRKTSPISQPWLGLHLDRPPHTVDPRGLTDCNNVRIALGRLDTTLMGYANAASVALPSQPIRGVFEAQSITGGQNYLIVGTTTDLMLIKADGTLAYITPIYFTGTAAASGTAVTGTGTAWATNVSGTFPRPNARPGDQISFGNNAQTDPNATWYTVQSVTDNTHLVLTSSAGTIANGNYTLRQCFSIVDGTTINGGKYVNQVPQGSSGYYPWAFENYPAAAQGDVMIATNGNPNDFPAFFVVNSVTPQPAIYATGLPFQCSALRRYKNMMIYGNLWNPVTQVAYPTSIANSDNGAPFTMAGGVAGQYVVSDGAYQINDIEVLGNTLMIYAGGRFGGDVIGAQFVGAPLFFTFTEIVRGRGPVSGRAVATFPDRHQFLAMDGEYRYNGLFIQPMNTHLWRGVMTNFDHSRANRTHCVINLDLGDITWGVPLLTDAGTTIQTAYVEHTLEQANNYLFKPFTKRDWPFEAAAVALDATNKRDNVAGDNTGGVWFLYQGNNAAQTFGRTGGTPTTSTLTFPRRFVINERSRGLVKRIYPFVEQTATTPVMLTADDGSTLLTADDGSTILTADTGSGTGITLNVTLDLYDAVALTNPSRTDTQTFDSSYSGNRFTTHYRRGRLARITISGPSGWVLDGGDWDVEPGGER